MAMAAYNLMAEERRFYGRMAIFMAVIVFVGFAPSFYMRGLIPFPRPNPTMTPLLWAHGLIFSSWIGLFYTQARLVAADRRDIHMKLGMAGFGLALLMIVMMVAVSLGQIARANQPPFVDPISWTAVPLVSIPAFVMIVALGWQHRRSAQVHKRFMLLSGLMMLEPAIGRMIVFPPNMIGQYASSVVALATVIPLILWDRRTLGHIHWATQLGAFAMAASLVVRYLVWQTAGWHGFVHSIAG
jgi:hypothetical protein